MNPLFVGYDRKFHEVNKFRHKRALALTAGKPVRVVFRLLKDNRLYSRRRADYSGSSR